MSKTTDIATKKRKGAAPEATATKKRTKVSTDKAIPAVAAQEEKVTSISSRNDKARKVKKLAKSTKKDTAPVAPADDFAGFSDSDDDDKEAATPTVKDQTLALAGFSDSESDAEPSIPISSLPVAPVPAASTFTTPVNPDTVPGTIYIGRLPHGFAEPQLRAYFSQFGSIERLRLSRNKVTGKPKHYAFIEFSAASVADIVARTMDKYLLFGHILQVRVMRPEEIHPELWKGAGKRFKAAPPGAKERRMLKEGRGREGWEKRIAKEKRRRDGKKDKMKEEYGYDFEAPEIKGVEGVKRKVPAVEDVPLDEVKIIAELPAAAAPVVVEKEVEMGTVEDGTVKRKAAKKEKKVIKRAKVAR